MVPELVTSRLEYDSSLQERTGELMPYWELLPRQAPCPSLPNLKKTDKDINHIVQKDYVLAQASLTKYHR